MWADDTAGPPLEVTAGGPDRPRATVVIPAYRARAEISEALRSLAGQTFREPFETIVVASGEEGCADYFRRWHPAVRVIESSERLWPGSARNIGVRAAQGEVIAFMPADAIASPRWLAARMAAHDAGAALVGGSIISGAGWHPVRWAEYLLEYSALMPRKRLLREQTIPHALSFKRSVFEQVGLYPEDTETGEDTLLNRRCIDARLELAFAPEAGLIHFGNRSPVGMWQHARAHGRGLAQCVDAHGLPSAIGSMDQAPAAAAWKMLVAYPAAGMRAKLARLLRFSPAMLPLFLALCPLISAGMIATGVGAWSHYRELAGTRRAKKRDRNAFG
jgi:hypothetical protein